MTIPTIATHKNAQHVVEMKEPFTRTGWIDSAKGLGIVTVVVGHALGGMLDAGLLTQAGVGAKIFYFIYTFHMALFFFLAGLFVVTRVYQHTSKFFIITAQRLAWPYLLWSVIQITVIHVAGNFTNHSPDAETFNYASLLWKPVSQFWFLHVLILLNVTSFFAVRLAGKSFMLILCALTFPLPEIMHLPDTLQFACHFGIFYSVGMIFGARQDALVVFGIRIQGPAIMSVIAICWVSYAYIIEAHALSAWSVAAMPAAIAGTAFFIVAAQSTYISRNRAINFLGKNSMAIFLLHVLFVAGGRIALNKVYGVTNSLVIFFAIALGGIVGPLMIQSMAKRAKMEKWLALG